MTVDPSFAGRSYPAARPYDVGREKIREFAAAVGDDHAAYVDVAVARALGYPDVVAPPTFASVLTIESWRTVLADLGVDFADVLHVDQKFTVTRPICAGDQVLAETVLDEVRERMGASWLGLRTELTTQAGEPLCTAFATIMVRGAGA